MKKKKRKEKPFKGKDAQSSPMGILMSQGRNLNLWGSLRDVDEPLRLGGTAGPPTATPGSISEFLCGVLHTGESRFGVWGDVKAMGWASIL